MKIEEKRAYKEALIILEKLNLLNYIPQEILNKIIENQDNEWDFQYDINKTLEEQVSSKETAILLSTLYLMYICDDINEKQELKKIYTENEKNQLIDYEIRLKAIYNQKQEGEN